MHKAAYFVYLSAIALLLGACEKAEDSLGLNLQAEEDLLNLVTVDDVEIHTHTTLADSSRTNELSLGLLGDISHPEFGSHQSVIFTQVRLSALGVDFTGGGDPSNVVLDSLVLSLEYLDEDNLYGSAEPMAFSVQRLSEDLDIDSVYFSNHDTETLGEELLFSTDPVTPFLNTETILDGDTLPAQLRLRLADSFGQELLDMGLDANSPFDDVDEFLAYLKGFRIEATRLGVNGGIGYYNLLSVNSKLALYYHNESDTVSFDFLINDNAQRYLQFQHDYTGTSIENQLSDSTLGMNNLYLQAMAGLNIYVDLSALTELPDTSQVAMNKAELVFPVTNISDDQDFSFPSRLFAVYTNELGNTVSVPDIFEGDTHSDGYYDEGAGEYRINVTRYSQQLMNGVINNPRLRVLPTNNSVTANFVDLVGSGGVDSRAKLVLTYTQFE